MLVVVHHRYIRGFGDTALNFKTLWRFDIFEVDASEGFRNVDHRADEFLWVFRVHFNVKHIDAGEGLQQQALSFHHGFAGERPDVSKAQHRGSVGNDGDQVTLRCVAIGIFGTRLDFKAGIGHSRGVGQTQLVSGGMGFGRDDFDFPLGLGLVVFQRFFAKQPVFLLHAHANPTMNGKGVVFESCARLWSS